MTKTAFSIGINILWLQVRQNNFWVFIEV